MAVRNNLRSPKVVVIYWDQDSTDTPVAVTAMNQFITDLVTGTYIDGLGQYGVGRGSFQGSVVISMATYPTPNPPQPGRSVFRERNAADSLVTWLDGGVVTLVPAGNVKPPSSHPILGPQRYDAPRWARLCLGFAVITSTGNANASGSDEQFIFNDP